MKKKNKMFIVAQQVQCTSMQICLNSSFRFQMLTGNEYLLTANHHEWLFSAINGKYKACCLLRLVSIEYS